MKKSVLFIRGGGQGADEADALLAEIFAKRAWFCI